MKNITAIIDGEEFEILHTEDISCEDCYFKDSCNKKSFRCPLDCDSVFKKKEKTND